MGYAEVILSKFLARIKGHAGTGTGLDRLTLRSRPPVTVFVAGLQLTANRLIY